MEHLTIKPNDLPHVACSFDKRILSIKYKYLKDIYGGQTVRISIVLKISLDYIFSFILLHIYLYLF